MSPAICSKSCRKMPPPRDAPLRAECARTNDMDLIGDIAAMVSAVAALLSSIAALRATTRRETGENEG